MKTRAALGSLAATAPLLAAELSRTGIPGAQEFFPCSRADRDEVLFCFP